MPVRRDTTKAGRWYEVPTDDGVIRLRIGQLWELVRSLPWSEKQELRAALERWLQKRRRTR